MVKAPEAPLGGTEAPPGKPPLKNLIGKHIVVGEYTPVALAGLLYFMNGSIYQPRLLVAYLMAIVPVVILGTVVANIRTRPTFKRSLAGLGIAMATASVMSLALALTLAPKIASKISHADIAAEFAVRDYSFMESVTGQAPTKGDLTAAVTSQLSMSDTAADLESAASAFRRAKGSPDLKAQGEAAALALREQLLPHLMQSDRLDRLTYVMENACEIAAAPRLPSDNEGNCVVTEARAAAYPQLVRQMYADWDWIFDRLGVAVGATSH